MVFIHLKPHHRCHTIYTPQICVQPYSVDIHLLEMKIIRKTIEFNSENKKSGFILSVSLKVRSKINRRKTRRYFHTFVDKHIYIAQNVQINLLPPDNKDTHIINDCTLYHCGHIHYICVYIIYKNKYKIVKINFV